MKYFHLFFAICMLIFNLSAQDKWNVWHEKYPASNNLIIETPAYFNGITIVFKQENKIAGRLSANDQLYNIIQDAHISFRNQSELIYFSQKTKKINLFIPDAIDSIDIYFQYSPEIKVNAFMLRDDVPCGLPPVLPQSVWRAGLHEPVYARSDNQAEHCIIHHADSPNWDSNYVSLTRAFYLQHTQVNGWSDIGYNYLVAWDGTLIAGRDPDSSGLAQDEVLGAHFCGKNTGTMGICVIGDYSVANPSPEAIHTLIRLLSWKLNKEHLAPKDSSIHYDELLPVIAGHRNGCPTLCPGDSLFALIPAIRDSVAAYLAACSMQAANNITETELNTYPNPVNDFFYLPAAYNEPEAILIINSMGEEIPFSRKMNRIELNNNPPGGIYICILRAADKFHIIKFIKI